MYKLLLKLANTLDKEGLKKEAKFIDFLIKIAAMDQLPIMADPVLWTTEQLIEVLKTPSLFEELKKDDKLLEKVIKELKSRNVTFGNMFKISPETSDYLSSKGFYLVTKMGSIIGIYNNKSNANLVAEKLKKYYENNMGVFDEILYDFITNSIIDNGGKTRYISDKIEDSLADLEYSELYKSRRKDLAEKIIKVVKSSDEFKPNKKYIIDEAVLPTWNSWPNMPIDKKTKKYIDKATDSINLRKAFFDFVDGEAKKIVKKQKMKEDGLDPNQMVDDNDVAANSIGLRENGIIDNMNQGFALEPFFSNYGTIQ